MQLEHYWRLNHHQFGGAPFVMWLIAQIFTEHGYEIQVGLTAKPITPEGIETVALKSADELQSRLLNVFGIDIPEIETLWPMLVERHARMMTEQSE